MNSKQIILIALFLTCFYLYSKAVNADSNKNYATTMQVATCGKAPGDIDFLSKLTWALCESKIAVDKDKASGK